MSEKSKGDTQSIQSQTAARVVKNPLLSASVTGLTYDDFPLLLPPVSPAVVPTRETPKTLVTVGKSLDIDAEEKLDEINLNAPSEETSPPAQIDVNSNPLLDTNSGNTESLLSQAASSFSVLPTVASTVLSTFSKRIYSGNSSRDRSPLTVEQDQNANALSALDIQPQLQQQLPPPHIPSTDGADLTASVPPFYTATGDSGYFQGTSAYQASTVPIEPPKFYSPTEVFNLPPTAASAAANNQNTYRISAKKKQYAPIPGLSGDNLGPHVDTSTASANIFTQTQTQLQSQSQSLSLSLSHPYTYPQLDTFGQQQPPHQPHQPQSSNKGEDRKGGGLFSLTNLVPTGVLQNISGLVQSAAGTLSPSAKSDNAASNHAQQPLEVIGVPHPAVSSVGALNVNYFGAPDNTQNSTGIPPPPLFYPAGIAVSGKVPEATNFFAASTSIQPGSSTHPLPPAPAHSLPPLAPSAGSAVPYFQPSAAVGHAFVPPIALSSGSTQPPSLRDYKGTASPYNFFTPTAAEQPSIPSVTPLTPASVAAVPPTLPQVPLTGVTGVTDGTVASPISLLTPTTAATVGTAAIPAADPFARANTNVVGAFNTGPPAPPAAPGFKPIAVPSAAAVSDPIAASAGDVAETHTTPLLPPAQATHPPPAGGQTSFRLQKGTRLYKNPLHAAETAPVYFNQPLGQVQSATQPQQTIFNPFAVPLTATSTSVGNQLVSTPSTLPPTASPEAHSVSALDGQSNRSAEASPDLGAPLTVDPSVRQPAPPTTSTDTSAAGVTALLPTLAIDSPLAIVKNFIAPDPEPVDRQLTEHLPTTRPSAEEQTAATPTPTSAADGSPVEADIAVSAPASLAETATERNSEPEVAEHVPQTTLSPTSVASAIAPPPPSTTLVHSQANPYRRGSNTSIHSSQTPAPTRTAPSLANFFTPAPSAAADNSHFDFFNTVQAPSTSLAEAKLPTSSTNLVTAASFFDVPSAPQNATYQAQQECVIPPLPPFNGIAPPPLALEPPAQSTYGEQTNQTFEQGIAPPLGFENIIAELRETTDNPDNTNTNTNTNTNEKSSPVAVDFPAAPISEISFSDYFKTSSTDFPPQEIQHQNQEQEQQQPQPQPQPQRQQQQQEQKGFHSINAFFDPFSVQQTVASSTSSTSAIESTDKHVLIAPSALNEDQRIQNFFNNPPPKEYGSSGTGDLNYELVHSGLAVRNLHTRSLSPTSNIVEPPSSSCSEFSELNISGLNISGKANIEKNDLSAIVSKPNAVIAPSSTSAVPLGFNHQYQDLPAEILHELKMANLLTSEKGSASAPPATIPYAPAVKHWFYKRQVGTKQIWMPFSHYDSALLETSLNVPADTPNIVAVEGGRYDVNIKERTKMPVYWEGPVIPVRRCSWFYKGADSKYVPYEESTADHLEAEYKNAVETGEWHKTIVLSMGEQVVFHGPTVMVQFQQQQSTDAWGGTTQATTRPRVVKRDLDDFTIEQGESQYVNHLVLMVHGIGSACDLKMRSVEEVVDDFRAIAQQLVQAHYKNSSEMGLVGRIEVLPISWHSHLHSEELGIDDKLKKITLESIPKLRNFTNDTLLDVLFYTCPTYCQKIVNTVAASMNAVYAKYHDRNPNFSGGVSLAGHSLGSLILFDLLCHQKPLKESEEDHNMENPDQFMTTIAPPPYALDSNQLAGNQEVTSKQISYTMGPAGTGQPYIQYAQLIFQPKKFFALGSPIGMFVCIRGIDKLGLDFRLPTCSGFYNIFHPFDPVAYRIEPLVNVDMCGIRPILIPHHKGRKRMHLELKETMTRVSADLKIRFLDTLKSTLGSVSFLGGSKSKKEAEEAMEQEVDKVLEMQKELEKREHEQQQQQQQQQHKEEQQQQQEQPQTSGFGQPIRARNDSTSTVHSDDLVEVDFPLGKLNDSKRIDYVLQEAPLEFFNEYLFALSSHVCYWESEDTILFVIKEIYSGLGVSPDSQVPQQTMTIERPSSRNSVSSSLLSPTT